jgi:hypothetical protein
MICDECETVAHCLMNGCVPKHQALDRMAENARELGLDYEPVQPVAWPIDEDVAKRIAEKQFVSYEVVQLIAREILATPPAAQRQWVGLDDADLAVCGDEDDVLLARYWERVCKEKNT